MTYRKMFGWLFDHWSHPARFAGEVVVINGVASTFYAGSLFPWLGATSDMSGQMVYAIDTADANGLPEGAISEKPR